MTTFGGNSTWPDLSNVVPLNVTNRRQPLGQRLARHAQMFVSGRRGEDDVFWLKENAEFLNILDTTMGRAESVLDIYQPFYDQIDLCLGEHPQYYRFILSICLDLEDLGMPGTKGLSVCRWTRAQDLIEAELSDLQRAEAVRLMARRGVMREDPDLRARLQRFAARSQTFAIPNKKAAYELTHIVFYLSEYGRRDPELGADAIRSLTFAGLVSYLDQHYDLLAEICIALRYAGRTPSPIWEDAVLAALNSVQVGDQTDSMLFDDYHAYLVCTWLAAIRRMGLMPLTLQPGAVRLDMAQPPARPLRDLSMALVSNRNADWQAVRAKVVRQMDPVAVQIVEAAERSTDQFDAFYEGFARTSVPRFPPNGLQVHSSDGE